jgi:hypothetical protein
VFEISWVAREERKIVGERDASDHGVVRPSARLAAGTVKGRGDTPERSGRRGVKGQGVKVCLRLLQTKLARRPLASINRHKGADGELCESHGRDEWCRREGLGVIDPLEQNHRAGVEDAAI